MDDDSWNNGTADLPVPLNGADLAEYEGPILRAVESCNSYNEGNLMLCFRKEWNPGVKEKVLSAIPLGGDPGRRAHGLRHGLSEGTSHRSRNESLAGSPAGSVFERLGRRF